MKLTVDLLVLTNGRSVPLPEGLLLIEQLYRPLHRPPTLTTGEFSKKKLLMKLRERKEVVTGSSLSCEKPTSAYTGFEILSKLGYIVNAETLHT